MKKPNREERHRMCVGKRRYRSQADALEAAALVGVERRRKAYLCPLCRQWHLTSSWGLSSPNRRVASGSLRSCHFPSRGC